MESDHILITVMGSNDEVIKITGAESFNQFVEMVQESGDHGIQCMSSMDYPFESTTSMDLVMLANQLSGNSIYTPDNYYQPIPAIRDANGIGEFCYWIMEENGRKDFPEILPESWLCYNEDEMDEVRENADIRLMDAIPQTLELI